jgi:hypothetical protein
MGDGTPVDADIECHSTRENARWRTETLVAFALGSWEYLRWMAIVRCSQGGLFETKWIPLAPFKAVRLGGRRLQRCPVHHKWETIERVDPATLTEAHRTGAAQYPAGWLP